MVPVSTLKFLDFARTISDSVSCQQANILNKVTSVTSNSSSSSSNSSTVFVTASFAVLLEFLSDMKNYWVPSKIQDKIWSSAADNWNGCFQSFINKPLISIWPELGVGSEEEDAVVGQNTNYRIGETFTETEPFVNDAIDHT